ncbi:MAG TPA: TolC family protein, partial [Gemmatimonadaceae bacterium]
MPSVSVRGAAAMFRLRELRSGRNLGTLLLLLLAFALCAGSLSAQQPARSRQAGPTELSLDEALKIAQAQSQAIEIARAGVGRASGQRIQARSQQYPQLSATAGYGRTLASQFSGFSATATPTDTVPTPVASQTLCTPFIPTTATAAERATALAQAATCPAASASGGFDLSRTSFGAKNQYNLA